MLRKIRESQREEGFTLIELLVVVIIIGILAAIAIPVFLNQREKAYLKAAQSDARNAAIVMETYFTEYQVYPVDQDWTATGANPVTGSSTGETVTVSQSVDLQYDLDETLGNNYCIRADHEAINGAGTYEVYYDSDAGGILPSGGAC
jgi:type IV pilus assembly protein PilA